MGKGGYKMSNKHPPLRSLRGMMQTEHTITGTVIGEVERADNKEMLWVSIVKGGNFATLDGMFNAEELHRIADWISEGR